MEMKWKDPPAEGARSSKWMKIFAELKEHPNRWAELYVGKSHNAYSLAGRLRPRHPEFEIIARKIEDGVAGVYAQYEEPSIKELVTVYPDNVPEPADIPEAYFEQPEGGGGAGL